jgi:prevent-host-death family protein
VSADAIGAFEAKTHFSELLVRAAAGETITVAKHGRPVAKLVPVTQVEPREDARRAAAEIQAAAEHMSLGGLRIKDLIAEGRR